MSGILELSSFAHLIETIDIQNIVDQSNGTRLSVLRLDQLDPITGGNKQFKLKYHIQAALDEEKSTLLSFGGAWSNHLAALARTGHQLGLKTIGIIRGEPVSNITLERAVNDGMMLKFISRSAYKLKRETGFLEVLQQEFPQAYIIPEGGDSTLGAHGCEELLHGVDMNQFDVVMLACGTGTTMAGIINSLPEKVMCIGIAALKDQGSIAENVRNYIQKKFVENWEVLSNHHFGGFAKTNDELNTFIQQFEAVSGIPTEPVYTGKLFSAAIDLIRKQKMISGKRVLLIHTGGLQYLR